jgi:hypothetical protein
MTTSAFAQFAERYEMVVGLEVHVQLKTVTKAFCSCSTAFGAPPNTNVCPVCLALPGALPVLNAHAVDLAVRASLALDCTVHPVSIFARKNYFYPDLPKGYQISQFDRPLATEGRLAVAGKTFGITRLHMEEDAGKSIHDRYPGVTAIDLNRSGVPLVEIVSEPDMRSAADAGAYLRALKQVLEYTDVSDVSMEEGSLRVDANISVRLHGARHQDRSEEHEFVLGRRACAGGRVSQAVRAGGRRRPCRAADHAVGRRRRRSPAGALERGKPRLSVLPGTRSAPAGADVRIRRPRPRRAARIAARSSRPVHHGIRPRRI